MGAILEAGDKRLLEIKQGQAVILPLGWTYADRARGLGEDLWRELGRADTSSFLGVNV
ncbi:MAG: hypothetical protein ACE5I9_00485 [Candidatus Methylomirabilales bacterium]